MNIQSFIYAMLGAGLLFIAGLTVGAIFYPQAGIQQCVTTKQQLNKSDKQYRIAVFQPVDQPALNEIAQGFQETLAKISQAEYGIKRFNANGDRTLLRAQAEEILHDKYDLVFTIGAGCTQLINELAAKKQIKTPVVFAAVDDPMGIGIIKSLKNSGNNLTGVLEPVDFQKQLAIVRYLKPNAKRLLLVYDPAQGTGLEKYKDQIAEIAPTYNFTFNALQIHEPSQLQERIKNVLQETDVILVLKDVGILAARDALVKLCNAYGVTLFASDLNTGELGAALAYGVKEYDFGTQGALKAYKILEENSAPSLLPSTPVPCPKLLINKTTAQKQGLVIDHALENVITNCQVIPCS